MTHFGRSAVTTAPRTNFFVRQTIVAVGPGRERTTGAQIKVGDNNIDVQQDRYHPQEEQTILETINIVSIIHSCLCHTESREKERDTDQQGDGRIHGKIIRTIRVTTATTILLAQPCRILSLLVHPESGHYGWQPIRIARRTERIVTDHGAITILVGGGKSQTTDTRQDGGDSFVAQNYRIIHWIRLVVIACVHPFRDGNFFPRRLGDYPVLERQR